MNITKKTIKAELSELVERGRFIYYYEAIQNERVNKESKDHLEKIKKYKLFKKNLVSIKSAYHEWYSKSTLVIRQLLPSRLEEFQKLYINEKRDNKDISYITYYISDYFLGLRLTKGWEKEEIIDPFSAFSSKMEQQIEILNSCLGTIDSKLVDIEGFLQAELFDTELETAKDLLKKKHIRVAGALAGVTLEVHLNKVCQNHSIKFRKQNPTISDFNESLKKNEIIDVPTWRLIQRLGDIRNLCVHSKDREPTIDEVEDLIRGCEKLIAEFF